MESKENTQRYKVHIVANANCDSYRDEVLFSSDDLPEVEKYASRVSSPFGAAIIDFATGEVDFGSGFGVPIEVIDQD